MIKKIASLIILALFFLLEYNLIAEQPDSSYEEFYNPMETWQTGNVWLVRTWLTSIRPGKRGQPGIIGKGPAVLSPVKVEKNDENWLRTLSIGKTMPYNTGKNLILICGVKTNNTKWKIIQQSRHGAITLGKIIEKQFIPVVFPHITSQFPLDFPVFQAWATNFTFQSEGREIHQQIEFDEKGGCFTTTLTTHEGIGDKEERKVVQRWEPGLPWWKWAKEYINGELKREGELVLDEDGKPLTPEEWEAMKPEEPKSPPPRNAPAIRRSAPPEN